MKTKSLLTVFILSSLTLVSYSQETSESITGIWKTFDDVTGEAKSHLEIYEDQGTINGRIAQLLRDNAASNCESCKGDKKDQPLIGMIVMEGLSKEKDNWTGGTIMDPENGKTYKCKISMESKDKLRVRGYIGFEALGRNQYWTRVE